MQRLTLPVIACGILTLLSLSTPAQQQQQDPDQARAERRAAAEARRYASLRDSLGVTDDAEWRALLPHLVTVQSLTRYLRDIREPDRAFRPPRPARTPDGSEPQIPLPLLDLAGKARDLQAVYENKAALPGEIQRALAAWKQARAKAEEYLLGELTKSRQELRDLVTARQELTLVVNGILD
jgi:hypothetical protein